MMKRKHSHVLLVLDDEARKIIDRGFQRASTIYDQFATWNRMFFRGDFNSETMEWEYTDVKEPEIARSRLLEDLASTSRRLGELKELVDEFREEVKSS